MGGRVSTLAFAGQRPFFSSLSRIRSAAFGSFGITPSGSKPRSPATTGESGLSPNQSPSHQAPRLVLLAPSMMPTVARPCATMPGFVFASVPAGECVGWE